MYAGRELPELGTSLGGLSACSVLKLRDGNGVVGNVEHDQFQWATPYPRNHLPPLAGSRRTVPTQGAPDRKQQKTHSVFCPLRGLPGVRNHTRRKYIPNTRGERPDPGQVLKFIRAECSGMSTTTASLSFAELIPKEKPAERSARANTLQLQATPLIEKNCPIDAINSKVEPCSQHNKVRFASGNEKEGQGAQPCGRGPETRNCEISYHRFKTPAAAARLQSFKLFPQVLFAGRRATVLSHGSSPTSGRQPGPA